MKLSNKLNLEEVDIDEFELSPLKITNIGIKIDLLYERRDFFFQTPICKVSRIDPDSNKIQLSINRTTRSVDFLRLLYVINGIFLRYTRQHYPDVDFKSSVIFEDPVILNAKLSKCMYFDSDKNIIISRDINVGDSVICLMRPNGLWINEETSGMKWNIFQVLSFGMRNY